MCFCDVWYIEARAGAAMQLTVSLPLVEFADTLFSTYCTTFSIFCLLQNSVSFFPFTSIKVTRSKMWTDRYRSLGPPTSSCLLRDDWPYGLKYLGANNNMVLTVWKTDGSWTWFANDCFSLPFVPCVWQSVQPYYRGRHCVYTCLVPRTQLFITTPNAAAAAAALLLKRCHSSSLSTHTHTQKNTIDGCLPLVH